MGQADDRRRKAAQFVRKYSQPVARDLPDNRVAQAVNDYEMNQADIESREGGGLMRGFQEWLFSDNDDGFALHLIPISIPSGRLTVLHGQVRRY